MDALKIVNGRICSQSLQPIKLRGFNLGGWLLMEGFILGGRNIPETEFLNSIFSQFTQKKAQTILENFWSNFININDLKTIKKFGFNCVRLPFHYKIFNQRPLNRAIRHFYDVVDMCSDAGLYCIVDMHAAPGSQNADWHSDSNGKSLFWENSAHRKLALSIWEALADKYKGAHHIAGFNLLNEPVTSKISLAAQFYNEAIGKISAIDKCRLIFLDGLAWSTSFSFMPKIKNLENIILSPHFYSPIDYVFNYEPKLSYPGRICGEYWDKMKLRAILKYFHQTGKKFNRPVFIGEFGINTSTNADLLWLQDTLGLFNEYNFSWALWTYKSVCNHQFPSGLFEYTTNSPWISRQGPVYGWENYVNLSEKNLKLLYESWKTKNFKLNKPLLDALKKSL